LSPEADLFFIIKAFAAGVILATGFMHVLPDAFNDLTSPCLSENPWGDFPFASFIAMMAAIVTLVVDVSATSYYQKTVGDNSKNEVQGVKGDEERPLHTHASCNTLDFCMLLERERDRENWEFQMSRDSMDF
jgi:solute carrier family 39 (zinc transporter), member 1/2/3